MCRAGVLVHYPDLTEQNRTASTPGFGGKKPPFSKILAFPEIGICCGFCKEVVPVPYTSVKKTIRETPLIGVHTFGLILSEGCWRRKIHLIGSEDISRFR